MLCCHPSPASSYPYSIRSYSNHALTRFLGPHGCRVGIISVLSVVFLGWRYAKNEIAIAVPSTDFLLES